MPIPLPHLDDRRFESLVDEGRAMIPTLAPAWTNHNPSDPGIVVLELLAWLTETTLYQLDQLPERNIETFLLLLGGRRRPGEPLDEAIRRTILDLRTLHRAVTASDYETLAATQWPLSPEAQALAATGVGTGLARVRAVPRRNLDDRTAAARQAEAAAHVSLVVIPADADGSRHPAPSAELCQALWAFLEPRRLLTARHHVVGPVYVPVELRLDVHLRNDAPPAEAAVGIAAAIETWFDPVRGGPGGTGWPFGRDVYVSEIDAEVSSLPLVDLVDGIELWVPGDGGAERVITDPAGVLVGVRLDAHELVDLRLIGLAAYTTDGTRYEAVAP